MRKFIIIFSCFLLVSCNQSKKFEFKASFYNIRKIGAFSYTGSDTLIQEVIYPEPKQHFYSLLNTNEKKTVDSLFQHTNFQKFDSLYTIENLPYDAGGILFEIKTKDVVKKISINGKGPKEFHPLIQILKKHSRLENLPEIKFRDFGDYSFLPPPPPAPPKIESNGR